MLINPLQEFIYDKSQSKEAESEFDMSDVPNFEGNENDRYSTNPKVCYYFANATELESFKKQIEIPFTDKAKTVWFPHEPQDEKIISGVYSTKHVQQPNYMIYIPSYKRSDTLYTVLSLEELKISNYRIIIRPTENEPELYRENMLKHEIKDVDTKILILPESYIEEQTKLGHNNSIIPRRYAFSIDKKTHHWVLDDNIKGFFRRVNGQKIKLISTAYPFLFVEEYIKRYTNVFQAGLQYVHLCPSGGNRSMIIKNSRVYSCILMKKDEKFNWEGSYNEDTDLSLRLLKAGKATMTFQNFLCGKQGTLSTKGGNTQIAYQNKGFENKAQELHDKHPDVTRIVNKYNRIHHEVNYSSFRENNLGYVPYKLNLSELILI